MEITPIKTRIFVENEDLLAFVSAYVKKIRENSILVVASKIVAFSEGRLGDIKDFEELVKQESQFFLKTKMTWLTIKDNTVMASAGIDESNASGKIVLLPKDSFKSAKKIRKYLKQKFHIKNLGVLITDSRVFPLRAGVVGGALGYAGFQGIRDYRGTKDIFNRVIKISRTNVADSLASAATLVMGEGNEQTPLGVISNAPVIFTEEVPKGELNIGIKEDMYGPLFSRLKIKKYGKK